MQTYQLEELFGDYEPFHSDLQIDSFILRRNGAFHPYGIYKQALSELKERFQTLVGLLQEQRKRLDQECEQDEAVQPIEALEQVRSALKHKDLASLFREFTRFYAVCCTLKQKLSPEGSMTAQRRAQLTEEWWEFKLKLSVVMDCRFHGVVARGTLEQVLCLPLSVRMRVLEFTDNREQQQQFWGELVEGKDLELPVTQSIEFAEHLQHLLADRIQSHASTPQATP